MRNKLWVIITKYVLKTGFDIEYNSIFGLCDFRFQAKSVWPCGFHVNLLIYVFVTLMTSRMNHR